MAKHNYSIQKQLQSRLAKLLFLLAILLLIPLHLAVRSFVDGVVSSRLEHDAESIISSIVFDQQSGWQLDQNRVPTIYQRVDSGHYFNLVSAELSAVSRSLWDADLNFDLVASGQTEVKVVLNNSDRLMLWTQGFRKSEVDFTIAVAEDVTALYRQQWFLELGLLALMFVIFILGLWLQRRMIRSGFATLTPIQKTLESGDVGSSITLPGNLPQEIAPLASALNQLLSRSSAQIERSRTGLGNLAHELKRPIQKLHFLANDLEGSEDAKKVLEASEEFQRLMERELRRARISGNPIPGRLFNPSEDLVHLSKVFERIYPDKQIVLEKLPLDYMPYDRDDLLELIGNLLDNACRYADREIVLDISKAEGAKYWVITIEDDGSGVTENKIELLSERGMRLDEDSPITGTGLGISISKAVVDSYEGDMHFLAAKSGGLKVSVQLPI